MAKIDPKKAKVKTAWGHKGTFYSLAVDPVSGRIFAGSDDYGIYVFDPKAEKKEPTATWTKHDNYVSALAWNGKAPQPQLISGSYDRQLIWWDPVGGTPARAQEGHEGWIRDLVLTPDGAKLVSVGDDMQVKIWDAHGGKLIHSLVGHATRTPQGHVTALYSLAMSPNGKLVASGDRIGEVNIWEVETGKKVHTLQVPTVYTYDPRQRKRSLGGIRSLAFSPDGKLLAVGGMGQVGNVDGLAGDAHIEIWEWQTAKQRIVSGVQKQKGYINDLLFHPREPWLLGGGGGGNGIIAFWQIDPLPDMTADKKANLPDFYSKNDGHVHQIALAPDGETLLAAGYRKLEAWTLG